MSIFMIGNEGKVKIISENLAGMVNHSQETTFTIRGK